MSEQEKLGRSFESTRRLVSKFAGGLTNKDSLALPGFKTNNFNWVLGHIIVGRDRVLELLDRPKIFSSDKTALYDTGSSPISEDTAVPLESLLNALDASQKAIVEGLRSLSDEDLAAIVDAEPSQTVLDRIEGLHWHETYHLGQLEILRQVSAERESWP